MKLKKIVLTLFISALLAGVFLLTMACTADGRLSLQGVLANVDNVTGQITVVTKDGQTHLITIDSKTQVTIDGKIIALEGLIPGVYLEIEEENGNPDTARKVEARLARIEGTIVQFQDGKLTVAPTNGGNQTQLSVDNTTKIFLEEEGYGTIADLKAGLKVGVKYDPQTSTALKIYINTEEKADIEGTVTQVSGNNITVKDKRGRTLTLISTNATQVLNGNLSDIKQGTRIEAKFDPITLNIFKIEINGQSNFERRDGDRDDAEENESDENEDEGAGGVETPPTIPHTLQGRADCLSCHGANGTEPFPTDHTGRTSATCTTCHNPA